MDVLNAHKLEADVGVVVLVFVALPRRTIRQRVQLPKNLMGFREPVRERRNSQKTLIGYLRPRVHHIDASIVVIGLADGLKHVFIFQTASAEARKRLTAPTHCRLPKKYKMTMRSSIRVPFFKNFLGDSNLFLLVEIREDGKAAFASELGASDDNGFTGRDGYV